LRNLRLLFVIDDRGVMRYDDAPPLAGLPRNGTAQGVAASLNLPASLALPSE